MDINVLIILMQLITAIITLASVILIYLTIKNNINLNQNNLFNELVKQERELRIKLSEYKREINKRIDKNEDFTEITLDYDTLVLNYYEYLSICLYQNLISEKYSKLYFGDLLFYVKDIFESSELFKKDYAKKNQYKGIQWLFKKSIYFFFNPFTFKPFKVPLTFSILIFSEKIQKLARTKLSISRFTEMIAESLFFSIHINLVLDIPKTPIKSKIDFSIFVLRFFPLIKRYLLFSRIDGLRAFINLIIKKSF